MRLPLVAAALAACALGAAGCGDDDSGDSAGDGGNGNAGSGGGLYGGGGGGEETQDAGDAATRLRLAANPAGELAFDKTSLSAKAGPVAIAFANPSRVPHAVEVEGNGVEEETETITEGAARLALDLEPGEYKFYCPVGNHEQAGMVGALTVR